MLHTKFHENQPAGSGVFKKIHSFHFSHVKAYVSKIDIAVK